jgi:hypothetical protein
MILINSLSDRIWKWNKRATDYRFLAELFRQQEPLAPLVRVTPMTRMPVHNKHGDPEETWMNWYFRAVVRSEGILAGNTAQRSENDNHLSMTDDYLQAVHHVLLTKWIRAQQHFHHKIARRFVYVNRFFHTLVACLFLATVSVCLLHMQHPANYDRVAQQNTTDALKEGSAVFVASSTNRVTYEAIQVKSSNWREGALLAILPAVLPALLAALHGLSMQAEFERLAERSEAMSEHLKNVAYGFATLTPSSVDNFGIVISQRAADIARTMLEEVLDWRVIFLAHNTELT